jgi:hypothetical protein
MAVHIDESRRDDESIAVDRLRFVRSADLPAEIPDFAVRDEKISDLVQAL